MTKFNSTESGAFFMALLGLALASWPVSFTLGAYGTVFYNTVLTIWLASLAALIGVLVIRRTREGEVYLTWWGALLLLIPTLLMTSGLWAQDVSWISDLLEWLLLLSLPYMAYLLLGVAVPEAAELHDRRLIFWLAFSFVLLNTISYLIGANNSWFFTCDDFLIAGDEAPANCGAR